MEIRPSTCRCPRRWKSSRPNSPVARSQFCATTRVSQTFGPVSELDAEYERAQVRLNATAVHDLTLAVLPQMVERGSGGILMVGSAAGNDGDPQ